MTPEQEDDADLEATRKALEELNEKAAWIEARIAILRAKWNQ